MAVFTTYVVLQQMMTVVSGNPNFMFCQLLMIQAKQFVPSKSFKVPYYVASKLYSRKLECRSLLRGGLHDLYCSTKAKNGKG